MRGIGLFLAGSVAMSAGLLGCGDDDGDDGADTREITLNFVGRVGAEDFGCGQMYTGLGSASSDLVARDFRLYIHDVRLVTADGTETEVELEQDGRWQVDNVALLDFEDGSGRCEAGTPETNGQVVGQVPEGDYTGVRFVLGVPFDLNHQDNSIAPAPLNLTSMFWDWNGGYKFLRIEGSSAGLPEWRFHLGSTGCDGGPMGGVTNCDNPNRADVSLESFDVEVDTVAVDIAALLEESDLETDANGPPGCMSGLEDLECAQIFGRLGLDFGATTASGEQVFFRAL